MLDLNQLYNMDCMDGMKQFPDKYFELAIVDPPYGGGSQIGNVEREREREKEGLHSDISYNGSIIGRFGGRFEKYHLGNEDRRNVGGKVQPTRRCL